MLFTAISWACAVATLAAFLYKIPALAANPRDPVLTSLCTYFLFNSIAYFVDLEVLRRHLSGVAGIPNVTTIIVQSSVIVLTAAQQITVTNLTLPKEKARRSTRRLIIGFGLSLVVLVTMFLIALPRKNGSAQEVIYLNLQDTDYALYFIYYLTVCAVGRYRTVLFAFRYARVLPDSRMRTGMRCVAAGSALILVYCAVRYWQVVALHVPGIAAPWKWLFWLIADVGTLIQTFGWTMPSWSARLSAVRQWFRSYRSYLRLAPLWRAVYRATPGIALEPPRHRLLSWIPPRPLKYHLYRRVIEIRDAQLALRQGAAADPIVLRQSEQTPGLSQTALREAAMLWSALRSGPAAPQEVEAALQHAAVVRQPPSGVDLWQEVAALTQVAEAFQALDGRTRAKKVP